MKSLLLTGATGFVGKNLIKELSAEQFEIAVIYRKFSWNDELINKTTRDDVYIITTSNPSWKNEVKKFNPEIVIHLAAYLTSSDSQESFLQLIESNITFGTHLLDALKDTSLQLFINTGTFAEYNNVGELEPAYLYAATKTAFRSIIYYYSNLKKFKVLNVIPYTIYGGIGSDKKLIDYIYDSLDSKNLVKMSPGDQLLDFIYIKDVINFFIKAVKEKDKLINNYSEVHLGTGQGCTPKTVTKLFEKITGKKANIQWGGISYRATDTMHSVAPKYDLKAFEWAPKITIEKGLKLYIQSFKKNGQHRIV